MIPWHKSRTALLAAISIGIVFVAHKFLFDPVAQTPHIADFTFPEVVPLSPLQLLASDSVNPYLVKPPAYISGEFVSGKRYRYLHNDRVAIDIEMRYLTNTNGDLKSFIDNPAGTLLPTLQYHRRRGLYSLFARQGKAYLSACINPRGGSTVTDNQFNRNRTIYDVSIEGIVLWLLGHAELQDRRCLWAHLSVPLNDNFSIELAYQTLETVWFSWYDWWSVRFPHP